MKKVKLLLFLMLLLMIPKVYAKTYNVSLVTDFSKINNSTEDKYLFVTTSGGKTYAWVNGIDDNLSKYAQTKANAKEITISEDKKTITIEDEDALSALWTFGLTKKSVSESVDKYTLMAYEDVYTDSSDLDKKHIQFNAKDSSKNPTGFTYTSDSPSINLVIKDASVGNVKLNQTVDKKTYWIQFSSNGHDFVTSDTEDSSKTLNIYKIEEKIVKNEKYQAPDNSKVIFNKSKNKHESYATTGVYQVNLDLSANTLYKNADILFVLDYSNSMNMEDKKAKLQSETNTLIDKLLSLNTNNRIGIVKFGKTTYLESESIDLGLTNNIEKLKAFVNKDVNVTEGGTNYTDAFISAKKILENNYVKNRDQIIIFITDGAPTIYNKTKYTVFNNTSDNAEGGYATNWMNYIMKYDLAPLKELKQKGVDVITIGVNMNEDMPITSTGTFIVKKELAQEFLKTIATSPNNFFSVLDYDNINETFDAIFDYLALYLKDGVVHDQINKNYMLVVSDFANYKPYIEIKTKSGITIEKITFNNDGSKAYSSLNSDENILNNNLIESKYFTYNFKTKEITWNVNKITEDKIILTYFIRPVKEKDKYVDDDSALNGEVVVNYKDYNDKSKEEKFNYNEDKTTENPQTGMIIPYIIISLIGIGGISYLIVNKNKKKMIKL